MMSSETARRIVPVLARFDADISAGRFHSRYDPSGDVLTIVFARPDSPLTSHDRDDGVYIDFDPDDPRITALTVVNYRSQFMPRHSSASGPGRLRRLWHRCLLVLDRIGVGGKYWERYATGELFRQVVDDYREALRREPHRLEALMQAPASA